VSFHSCGQIADHACTRNSPSLAAICPQPRVDNNLITGEKVTEFFYDALGRKISERVTLTGRAPNSQAIVDQRGFVFDGQTAILEFDEDLKITRGVFTGMGGVILAEDIAKNVSNTAKTVWSLPDNHGKTGTLAAQYPGHDDVQVQHLLYSPHGEIQQRLGVIDDVLNSATVSWRGMEFDSSLTTYTSRTGRTYDPVTARFHNEVGPLNGYSLAGGNPYRNSHSIDWSAIEGPGPFSGVLGNTVGRATYAMFGDQLATASDTELFLGTAAFSTAIVFGGWAALGQLGLLGAGGAAAAEVSYLGAAGTALSYTSLGMSSAQVAFSGGQEGWGNLAMDAFGVGALKYAGRASGLARTAWMAGDVGVNLVQGGQNSYAGYQQFRQGHYGSAAFSFAMAGLSFGGAATGATSLRRSMALDPTMNPLNYRLKMNRRSVTLGMNGAHGLRAAPRVELPHGFYSMDEFGNFGSALRKRLDDAGFDDVQAVLHGSSVTGVRANSKVGIPAGTPFDVIKHSDFDVAIVSPTMFAKAKELNIPLRGAKTRTAPLRRGNLHQFDIADLPEVLRRTLYKHEGRQINFMIFETMEDALKRGPSIGVPGT